MILLVVSLGSLGIGCLNLASLVGKEAFTDPKRVWKNRKKHQMRNYIGGDFLVIICGFIGVVLSIIIELVKVIVG